MRPIFILLITCLLAAACAAPMAAPGATTETDMPTATPIPEGALEEHSFTSAVLGREQRYAVYLPAGYAESGWRYPVLYLLHGRGDNLASWARLKPELDALIAAGDVPALVAILPDAPTSQRASYYVDSDYAGAEQPGARVETALLTELLPHVEAAYRVHADRDGRFIGGYSMGGYGALRYALAHPELFAGALVLSPAVYTPLPPADSSAREFGAFGRGDELFVDEVYQRQNYPALLESFAAAGLTARIFIAVGDDEYKHPDPAEAQHDLDLEAHLVYNRLTRVSNLATEFRVLDGGHGWDVWTPAFVEGLRYLGQFLRPPE